MSGPLSSDEIEDVVSSVRRLVSADPRSRPLSRDLGPDRLVLTPALRVVSDAGIAPLILTNPTSDPAPEEPVAAAVPEPQADPVPAEDAAPPAAIVEAEWEDQIWQEPDPPLAELALEAEEAEVVLVDDREDDDAPWSQGEADWPDEDDLAEVVHLDSFARSAPSAEPGAPVDAPTEAAAAAVPPQAATEPAPDASALADAVADHRDPEAAEPATSLLYDKDGNPLTVLDEDALHDIVRQLIREELQGTLGERITRNVRKLVRAEINRALTARALD
jgi:hypothetical protein